MKQKLAFTLIPLLLVLGVVAGWYYLTRPAQAKGEIMASGFIEAEEVSIVPEVGGRIKEIMVDEGDPVAAGSILVRLDDSLHAAQLGQARAATAVAQAALDQIKAGARGEDIEAAEAALQRAIAEKEGAVRALEDAQAMRENPQELNLQVEAARTQLEAATYGVGQAIAQRDAAEEMRDFFVRTARILEEGVLVTVDTPKGEREFRFKPEVGVEALEAIRLQRTLRSHDWWAAWEKLNGAVAQRGAAERLLEDLLSMLDNPLTLNAQVDAAQTRYRAASAAVEAAAARLKSLKEGATAEQLAIAKSRVREALAAEKLMEIQLSKMSFAAPIGGIVVNRYAQVGEIATPGVPILTLANLDQVTLRVFIPERQIGRVKVGQPVWVTVDSFPGESFPGRVSFIAEKAEFTPRNVQTQEERVKTIFAVRIKLANVEHKLKPGMPADARWEVAQ